MSAAKTKSLMRLNVFQKAVLSDYCDGAFAHLAEDGAIEDPHGLGDTLLTFMLIELSGQKDCETIKDATSRLHTARDEIDVALAAMEKLSEAIAEKIGVRAALDREP